MENNERYSKKNNTRSFIILIVLLTSISLTILSIIQEKSPNSTNNNTLYNIYTGQNAVQIINIYGVIEYQKMLPEVLAKLKIAEQSNTIKAIIFRINSPGGTVGASQAIYKAIQDFKAKTKKPVLSVFGDVAASGGYYIAMASDEIFAQGGTITGSIGVIIMGFSFEKLFQGIGIKQEIIKSGQFKDLFSSIATTQTSQEKALLQGLIDETYTQFYQVVKEGRKGKLSEANLKKYTDGRIFNGARAQSLGFIDRIGGLTEAIESLKQRFKLQTITIIDKNRSRFDELFDYFSYKKNSKDSFLFTRGIPLYLHVR